MACLLCACSVSALGFQTNRVHVYLAQPLQPGQSRVRSSAATACTSAYDEGVVNILGFPDVYCIPNRVTMVTGNPVFFFQTGPSTSTHQPGR